MGWRWSVAPEERLQMLHADCNTKSTNYQIAPSGGFQLVHTDPKFDIDFNCYPWAGYFRTLIASYALGLPHLRQLALNQIEHMVWEGRAAYD
jgi:hypothetical protein